MFTEQLQEHSATQPKDYLGVDLISSDCYNLNPNDPIFKQYEKSELHYVIAALQKGFTPPTKRRIKKLKCKNWQKNQTLKLHLIEKDETKQSDIIQPLNPKSPEQICLKALRKEALEQICSSKPRQNDQSESIHQQKLEKQENKPLQREKKSRKPKFIRKEQNQLRRRIQLITLIKQNKKILIEIFGRQKMEGFNKKTQCPKISRQQVKEALKKYYEVKNLQIQEKIKNLTDPVYRNKKIEEERRNWQQRQKKKQKKQNQTIGEIQKDMKSRTPQRRPADSQDKQQNYSDKSQSN